MIRGFYTATSSLVAQQAHMNTIANNVANVNTTGFKAQQTGFASLLYANMHGGAGAENEINVGHGVKVQQNAIDFSPGTLMRTNMPFDLAIVGEGFFALEEEGNEQLTYTRDGSFSIFVEGDEAYLVNSAGRYVLDPDGNRIQLQERIERVKDEDVKTGEWDFDASKVGVFNFPNPYGLSLRGGNGFAATDVSGEAEVMETPNVQSGYLEGSGVSLSKEMVKMIEASKGFSLASKIVQTSDELEKIINQLR